MSLKREIEYRIESTLTTLDTAVCDRESQTYVTGTSKYIFYNQTPTSILETRGTSGVSTNHVFVADTDYTLSHLYGGWGIKWSGGETPTTATSFECDYVYTPAITVSDSYPCARSLLPYISIETVSLRESPMNAGKFSSRGHDTVRGVALVYVTVWVPKETDRGATVHNTKKELLDMYVDAIWSKMIKNKRLGDYIVDISLDGMDDRRWDKELNAFTQRLRFRIEAIKEVRF